MLKITKKTLKNDIMSETMKVCPKCNSPYGYSMGNDIYACPECYHEWNPEESIEEDVLKVVDANGNPLANGD